MLMPIRLPLGAVHRVALAEERFKFLFGLEGSLRRSEAEAFRVQGHVRAGHLAHLSSYVQRTRATP